MPKFSDRSIQRLLECEPALYNLFMNVIEHFDCTVLCGHRGEEEQNEAFESGHSKLRWPDSKHNSSPSRAVDVAPYPVDWMDEERMIYFAGFVKGMAAALGIKIKGGVDWDNDTEVKDNTFTDLVHFQIEES